MNLIQELWLDESGLVLSAETVMIGTVGVLGAVVGMNAVNSAVNDELKEVASAIRSFDQSYGYVGHRGCGAWTAGSYYIQPTVQQSVAEINSEDAAEIKAIQRQVDEERKSRLNPVPELKLQVDPVVPTPIPNQIPKPEPEKNEPAAEPRS